MENVLAGYCLSLIRDTPTGAYIKEVKEDKVSV
jgi:hypothetical protein